MSDKKRQPNFTGNERVKFIRCLKNHSIILCKKTNSATNVAKEKAWEKLTIEFNSINRVPRTVASLKKLWERMKSEAKLKHASHKQEIYKTGGGAPLLPLDPITNAVLSILGRSGIGIDNVNDSDMKYEPKVYNIVMESLFIFTDTNVEISQNQNSVEIFEITPNIDTEAKQSSPDSYLPSDFAQVDT